VCAGHVELLCLEIEVRDGLYYQCCYVLLHYVIIKLMVTLSTHWVGLFFTCATTERVLIFTSNVSLICLVFDRKLYILWVK
jgi:hypothetical protein